MALPRLQLRKGTTAPSGAIALVAEPFVDTTNKNFYIADGASSFIHIGGGTYTSRVDEFLTASVASTSVGSITLKDAQATQNSVTLDVPATVSASYSFTLPANAGTSGYVLQTDGSGNTSWVTQTTGYAGWSISDGTTTEAIASADTVTVTGGSGIAATVSATDTLTIDLDINELTALDAEGGTDPLVVADSIAVYDASATGNKKVTVANLETVIFADISGDITIAANGTATIAANSVALGTDTTGNYVGDVTAGAGLTKTSSAGEGQTVDLAIGAGTGIAVNADDVALNITGLTTTAIADADELAFYDVTGTTHGKITADGLRDYVLGGVSGDITIDASGVASIAANSVALGTDTTGQYASTITGGSGIAATSANADDATAYTIDLDINELTALDAEGGTDPLVVGDSIPVYDASATGNKKVTVSNLETVIFADVSGDITIGSGGVAAIGSGVIVDADISGTAEIAVSKLANGTARQLLQTDAAGTGVEWATNIDVPGTLDVTGKTTLDGDLDVATAVTNGGTVNVATGTTSTGNTKIVNIATNGAAGSTTSVTIGTSAGTSSVTVLGDLTVTGTTTTVNTDNTVVKDSLIELANGTTGTPTSDAGLIIERGDLSNVFVGYDEGSDVFVVGTTTATGSSSDTAPTPITFLAGALNLTDTAGANESVISYLAADTIYTGQAAGRYLQNVNIDLGTY